MKAVIEAATSTPMSARVWVYVSFSAARPKDAMGFGICPPHHARPAFTKCFLNMPRAM